MKKQGIELFRAIIKPARLWAIDRKIKKLAQRQQELYFERGITLNQTARAREWLRYTVPYSPWAEGWRHTLLQLEARYEGQTALVEKTASEWRELQKRRDRIAAGKGG